ncbi:methyltransferase domain-containing protein [Sesbania bispinosa]|nr:methyltransferase domain-containing protein [Sesbania bispinosa]
MAVVADRRWCDDDRRSRGGEARTYAVVRSVAAAEGLRCCGQRSRVAATVQGRR